MARKSNRQNEGLREDGRTNGAQSAAAPAQNAQTSGNGNGGAPESSDTEIFSSDEIAERAYQIFEREGRMNGRDMDHWLQAERELRMERERRGGTMNPENAPRSARQHQRNQ